MNCNQMTRWRPHIAYLQLWVGAAVGAQLLARLYDEHGILACRTKPMSDLDCSHSIEPAVLVGSHSPFGSVIS